MRSDGRSPRRFARRTRVIAFAIVTILNLAWVGACAVFGLGAGGTSAAGFLLGLLVCLAVFAYFTVKAWKDSGTEAEAERTEKPRTEAERM